MSRYAIAVLLLAGCGRSGPSYDDALQTFITESALLQSLTAQRAAELEPLVGPRESAANDIKKAKEKEGKVDPEMQATLDRGTKFRVGFIAEADVKIAAIEAKYGPLIDVQTNRVEKAKSAKDEAEKHR